MTSNISAIFGAHDKQTLAQLADVASRAERAALMSDGQVGYVMPVGGVVAYRDKVSVVGVGVDIACGNAAIRTDLYVENLIGYSPEELRANPSRVIGNRILNDLADTLQASISFGLGRKNQAGDAPVNHPLFRSPAWGHVPNNPQGWFRDELREKARHQLGTVGTGNHYVDVFYDEQGRIWVGVHFGSRGFGYTVASAFLALSQGLKWGARAPEREVLLDIRDGIGLAYWDLMNLCGEYAYAGREWVARKVVQILGGTELDLVHNHHNHAWKETHGGEEYIVVRKGATPAFPGQRGFVGGSMGDNSVILRGTQRIDEGEDAGSYGAMAQSDMVMDLQASAMYSTVHGAGRVMSRTEAAGKRDRKTGQLKKRDGVVVNPGKVSPEMMKEWLGKKGVVLRGGGLDESPHCYRRLPDVLEAQQGTVEILHTLTPLVVVMAASGTFDPYAD